MSKIIFNGVDYAGGSGNYFNPVIYSDTERKIGVWRDNKPLYKKTIPYSITPTSGDYIFEIETLSNDIVVQRIESDRFLRSGYLFNEVIYPPNTLYYRYSVNEATHKIDVRVWNSNTVPISGAVTIYYTKTTDVAGSGDYNTLGVPTVHYSTSEQVIGTWIDGKSLYEKTINFGALPNNESKKVNHNIANVKRIWIYDGYAFNSVSGYCNQLNLSGTANISSQWYSGCTDTFVEVRPNSDRTAYDECYITVRYTKTTD